MPTPHAGGVGGAAAGTGNTAVFTLETPSGEEIVSPISGAGEARQLPIREAVEWARATTGMTPAKEDVLVQAAMKKARGLESIPGPGGLAGLTVDEAAAINIYTQQSPV